MASMTCSALDVLVVIMGMAAPLIARSGALGQRKLTQKEQISFGERCGVSNVNLLALRDSDSCCAFRVWPDGQLDDDFLSGGRTMKRASIKGNFVLKRAEITPASSPESFSAQANGFDYFFICAPGTDFPSAAPGMKHLKDTSSFLKALFLLRRPVGYFGVRTRTLLPATSMPKPEIELVTSPSKTTRVRSSLQISSSTKPLPSAQPASSEAARFSLPPFDVSQGNDVIDKDYSTTKQSRTISAEVPVISSSLKEDRGKSSDDNRLLNRGLEEANRSRNGSSGGQDDLNNRTSLAADLNVTDERRHKKRLDDPDPAVNDKTSLEKLVVDLIRELARDRLRRPPKTSKLKIKEMPDATGKP